MRQSRVGATERAQPERRRRKQHESDSGTGNSRHRAVCPPPPAQIPSAYHSTPGIYAAPWRSRRGRTNTIAGSDASCPLGSVGSEEDYSPHTIPSNEYCGSPASEHASPGHQPQKQHPCGTRRYIARMKQSSPPPPFHDTLVCPVKLLPENRPDQDT